MRSSIGVFWLLATLFTSLGFGNASAPTTSDKPGFIKASGKKFTLDGKLFQYLGTNAYWLQLLNKKDLNQTMHDMAAIGLRVVRTWAFNDVTEIPDDGVWFQVFHKNGTIEINEGENGLVRLDNIVQAAKDNNLRVVFSLTNNWFRDATSNKDHHKAEKRGNYTEPPVDRRFRRNFLSNSYGGMDVYIKHFSKDFHDEFYTCSDIVDAYSRYIAKIVKRYAHEPAVLGWELANDPRCSSGLPASGGCNPRTITRWAAIVSAVVKENAPNHLVSVGDGGFYCVGCPKLFPREPPTPPHTEHTHETKSHETKPHETKSHETKSHRTEPPHPTMTHNGTAPPHPTTPNNGTHPPQETNHPYETSYRRRGYLTEADLHRFSVKRATRRLGVRTNQEHCATIGGHYAPRGVEHEPEHKPETKTGAVFDGSFGIDTEDLVNIPTIDFSTLQYFPHQQTSGPNGEIDLFDPDNIAQNGIDWVKLHAKTGKTFDLPVSVTGFGLLTDESLSRFVPFNPNEEGKKFTVCTTVDQRADIFDKVFGAGIDVGVNIEQYMWGQRGLSSTARGPIRRQVPEGQVPQGSSPDDGHGIYNDDPTRPKLAGGADLNNQAGPGSGDYTPGPGGDEPQTEEPQATGEA